jgi:hypothetical protein
MELTNAPPAQTSPPLALIVPSFVFNHGKWVGEEDDEEDDEEEAAALSKRLIMEDIRFSNFPKSIRCFISLNELLERSIMEHVSLSNAVSVAKLILIVHGSMIFRSDT